MGPASEEVYERIVTEVNRGGRCEVLRVPRKLYEAAAAEVKEQNERMRAIGAQVPESRPGDVLSFAGPTGWTKLEIGCGHPRQTWEGVDLPCADPQCMDGPGRPGGTLVTIHRRAPSLHAPSLKQCTWERQTLAGLYGTGGPLLHLWMLVTP